MAELLAVAGGISSFLSVAEVASKLVRGCMTLIKGAKNAPKDVRKLVQELESLSNIARGIERIVGEMRNLEVKTKVDEAVRLALERCVEVVGELRGILDEYENRFRRHGVKLWWEKVKVVKGKKGVATLLERIGRAKLDLVLAHQNASSVVARSQSGTLDTMSQSVSNIHNTTVDFSTKIDNTLDQGKEMLTIGNMTKQQTRDSETQRREDFQNGMRQLEAVSDAQDHGFSQTSESLATIQESIMSTSARVDNNLERTQAVFTVTERTQETVVGLERSQRDSFQILQSIEQKISNPDALVEIFAQALAIRDRGQERDQLVEVENYADAAVQGDNIKLVSSQGSLDSSRRRTRWKNVSCTRYLSNRYLSIQSATWEENLDEEDLALGLDSLKATKTCITFRSTLPFFKRALYYTMAGTVGDPLYERKLRQVAVFSGDSAIWKACKSCDLDEVRRLFISGEASPFMENKRGDSLPEAVLWDINWEDNFVHLFDLLIQARGRRGVSFCPQKTCQLLSISLCVGNKRWRMETVDHYMRGIIRHSYDNPFDYSNISSLINFDNIQHTIVTTITQQTAWSLDLGAHVAGGVLIENERHMLQDPKADHLKVLLESAETYQLHFSWSIEAGWDRWIGFQGSRPYSPIALMLHASISTRDDLRECCKNRLKLLISTPKFHRLVEATNSNFGHFITAEPNDCYASNCIDSDNDENLGRYAIRNGYRPFLEDLFREIGWRDMEIDDFFDRETFYGVPGLLNGQIIYETTQDAQRQFITNLCDGAFTKMSPDEVESVVRQIGILIWSDPSALHHDTDSNYSWYTYYIQDTIEAANLAFLSKNMPGSWPEDGEIRLVPGVDFTIRGPYHNEYFAISPHQSECYKRILSWYRDYIDPDFVIYLPGEDF